MTVASPLTAPPPNPGSQIQLDAAAAVAAMGAAIKAGDFSAAEAAGAVAPVNLAWPKDALQNLRPLSDGAQAAVFAADVAPAWSHLVPDLKQGKDPLLTVAVKRAHIRHSQGAPGPCTLRGAATCTAASRAL